MNQMRSRSYWIERPEDKRRQRFGSEQITHYCWVIDLDKHPLGYCAVIDEAFEQSWHMEEDLDQPFLPSTDWLDPRRGELFSLAEALNPKRSHE
jgi:hypothetical protein